MAIHPLRGLRATPYASYLSCLGILRILAEQADASTTGWWSAGHFHLQTGLDWPDLLDFFTRAYRPTPIASPWNANSGFYPGEDSTAIQALAASTDPRFAPYREALEAIRQSLRRLNLAERPARGKAKLELLADLRATLPPAARRWMDAVVTIGNGSAHYSPLYFTGGNDGRLEMSRTFLSSLHTLFLAPQRGAREPRAALEALLQDQPAPFQTDQTHGPFEPASSQALNGDSTGQSPSRAAPWRWLLALEGLLLLDPRDQRPHEPRGPACLLPEETVREDIWLPLWTRPLRLQQLPLHGKAPLFFRYAVVARNGRSHFALPLEVRPAPPRGTPAGSWLKSHGHQAASLAQLGKLRLHATDLPTLRARDLPPSPDTVERRLATSLAGLGADQIAELRVRGHMPAFRGNSLCDSMIALARRRARVARGLLRHAAAELHPFRSPQPATARDLKDFLDAAVDDRLLSLYLHALCLTRIAPTAGGDDQQAARLLPLPFRLAKLAFTSYPGDRRPVPLALLDHLRRENWQQAAHVAVGFLRPRHPGLTAPPMASSQISGSRIAAALLFPISSSTYHTLLDATLTGFPLLQAENSGR